MTAPAVTLYEGDCLDVLRQMPEASVDAVVTDPPYGLAFMGKRWDYDVPSEAIWRECLRVLKPGGHLLAFAGTRTQHRMAVRIEDAGFEIRDLIAWVYGSGFPKSLDVSKAIDKANGRRFSDRFALGRHIRERREACGYTRAEINAWLDAKTKVEHYESESDGFARVPTLADWQMLKNRLGLSSEWDALIARIEAEREAVGMPYKVPNARAVNPHFVAIAGGGGAANKTIDYSATAPATDAARQWAGWGTALKPALEPITVARKPLAGTVAETVLSYGTGAINVDGCRAECDGGRPLRVSLSRPSVNVYGGGLDGSFAAGTTTQGRWPANLIHDGGPDVTDLLGEATRFFYCAKASRADREAGCDGLPQRTAADTVERAEGSAGLDSPRAGAGRTSGARNHHPTVKPTDLMRYLCRLVTQPGGVVLDPFMGSGSTGRGAVLEGFAFVGIEREADYLAIARARIEAAQQRASAPTAQLSLFDGES